ncbi:phosphate-starvation-inducible PsiE family protein [Geodermatophilus sp. YIM 151500]|uniref:phosphate-starvation-inducible PsiE family protein n=1 Tax=Geodermatophilus sp. YIM 151500 TaxID=2984531 RepID=UPI0021E49A23|nr:phosphate-starvation-inducible PsiE family protein [Geodermatophilus sp. YIM 151500]
MAERRRSDPERRVPPPGFGRLGTRVLEIAENVVYAGIVLFLVLGAAVLLVLAGRSTWRAATSLQQSSVLELLDVLLLVFIVVELLFAVRSTVEKRELVAEPFLLVGIIASIKEIVVLSVEAAGVAGDGAPFDDRMTEIAILGVLVLLLGLTSWLLRRKEREPIEGERADTAEK